MDPLIENIPTAFAKVVYPGDDNLTDSTYGEEPEALVEDFRGKTDWRALDAAFLDQAPDGWGSALSFFSGPALRFYLPAYLIADVNGQLQTADPGFSLCWGLTPMAAAKKIAKPWGGGTIGEYTTARFDLFDAAQVSTIVAYLWWKLESSGGYDPVIEQALEHYWLDRENQG